MSKSIAISRELQHLGAGRSSGTINLKERGIDSEMAAELRWAFQSFVAEWESPEMDIYDDYDASRSAIESADQALRHTT